MRMHTNEAIRQVMNVFMIREKLNQLSSSSSLIQQKITKMLADKVVLL